ncbi:MAG: FecR domain-containing protein [Verrucomicrobia bacterium]|nr:FecR domain-containing protein [Verrucomicrobiota bacterium]
MRRPEPPSPAAEARSQAAADWLVRRDRGLTGAEQDEFLQWLAADPRHGEWLALHRGTVADFSALADWRPEHSEEPNPDLLAPAPRRSPWIRFGVLAAAAAVVLAVFWAHSTSAPETAGTRQTDSELKRRILEDGSTVELNRGAVVTISFSAGERRATLVSGEALFAIAKDPRRPFVVRAGGVDVRAVGTAFSVRLDSGAVEVLVTEGRVAVAGPAELAAPATVAAPPEAPAPTLVDAGHRATLNLAAGTPPEVVPVSPQAIARQLNWQPQLLDFSSAPLAVAVAEFNRRNRVQFVLADADLADLPIVASVRSDNVEGFARFLAAAPGLKIERRGAAEIVVRRKR